MKRFFVGLAILASMSSFAQDKGKVLLTATLSYHTFGFGDVGFQSSVTGQLESLKECELIKTQLMTSYLNGNYKNRPSNRTNILCTEINKSSNLNIESDKVVLIGTFTYATVGFGDGGFQSSILEVFKDVSECKFGAKSFIETYSKGNYKKRSADWSDLRCVELSNGSIRNVINL